MRLSENMHICELVHVSILGRHCSLYLFSPGFDALELAWKGVLTDFDTSPSSFGKTLCLGRGRAGREEEDFKRQALFLG